jgi:fructuronate reductase
MALLGNATPIPSNVRRPRFDRKALRTGIVHIGLGAFHRAHQAVYTDDALESEYGDWGIAGASLRSLEIAESLKAQDCLYSVTARDESRDATRVVGSLLEAIPAVKDRPRLLTLLGDPQIKVVTLTVSEKAYGIDPASGGLAAAHSAVQHDLLHPDAPIGVVGLLVYGLEQRWRAGAAPFTALCCDNLPNNGRMVRRLVAEMAALRSGDLCRWIEDRARFPSSMVDRIVPGATDETRERAAAKLGAEDQLALETETFSQWVIEDDFIAGRPAWEAGGALMVGNVEPYEKMKLRLLNGSHSLIAYLGQLYGLTFVRDVMAVPARVKEVRRHMAAVLPTLDAAPGIDLDAYQNQLIVRFANPKIAHRTLQIAMDGTQKLPQRIFSPAIETLSAGGGADPFAFATALWLAYVVRAPAIDDPRRTELKAAADSITDADPSAAFFSMEGLFPAALVENRGWRNRVNAHLERALAGAAF